MRNPLASAALLAALSTLGGCSSSRTTALQTVADSVASDWFGSFNAATVELQASGGFAPMSIRYFVAHDDRSYVFSQRMLCSKTCPAPLDSASGTLPPNVTDSLFNIVLAEARQLTKNDYGITKGGADMRTYVLTIRSEGKVATARADDGTMPEPMRRISQTLSEIVSAARQ